MNKTTAHRAALAALATALAVLAQDAAPREASALPPPLALPREVLREEFFALDLAAADGTRNVGYAAWRRRREDRGQLLELDVYFPDEQTRVRHVEQAQRDTAKLVWREWRPGAGRTQIVRWADDGRALEVVEWGRSEGLRTALPVGEGAFLPLCLLELARRGDVECGAFEVFDPLSRALERLELSITYAARGAADDVFELERTLTLRRADLSTAGEYTFCGDELVGFRWQSGGLRARRIAAEEFVRATTDVLVGAAASALESTVMER